MANGSPIKYAIDEAILRVAKEGYEKVDLREVVLAMGGYIANRFEDANRGVIRIKIEGRRWFAVGTLLGGLLGALVKTFVG